MAAKLVAEKGTLKGLVLSLADGDQWVIGRDPDSCQLLVEDPVASRRHLICYSTPEGILLENLSTTNPVLINFEEVKTPRLLQNGDLVKIGSGQFRFYAESEARLFNEDDTPLPLNGDKSPHENEAEGHEEESFLDDAFQEEEKPEQHTAPNQQPIEDKAEDVGAAESFHDEIFSDEEFDSQEEKREIEHTEENADSKPDAAELPEEPALDKKALEEEVFSDDDLDQDELKDEDHMRHEAIFEEEVDETQGQLASIDFDISETGRWLLKVISGPNSGAELVMQSGHSYLVGSDPNTCDIIFHDTSVSRQHVRLAISDDDIITIEDLNSRNGTLVDGQPINGKHALQTNLVVNVGTTAFVVFDREGEMQTIISPLLPSIVNVLKKEESEPKEPITEEKPAAEAPFKAVVEEPAPPAKEKSSVPLTAFILIAIITGAFVLVGIGMITLFQSAPVEVEEVANTGKLLDEALDSFPAVQYTYNKTTGTLMIVGHVLTDNSKRQLIYNLQGLNFIRNIDVSGIVIDEKVWQEFNPLLSRNPAWRGVSLQATAPGQFVLTGYLKNRQQMDSLVDYMSTNFLYLDRLKYRVVVEESVVAKVKSDLMAAGFPNINVSINNGDLVLKGVIAAQMQDKYQPLLDSFAKIPGIHSVQNLVSAVQEDRSIINITDRYLVTGVSKTGNNVSVVIDGKIVSKGDTLDGMKITEITPKAMFLESDDVKYRIDLR